jgi:pimeloyl-[acyl-carrier protein] methyl ester esterase
VSGKIIGSGPDLALIHGWGLGSTAWEPILKTLAPRCRVHLIDLPGYGGQPASNADFTQTAQALIDSLPDGVTLCGWSLGGMLALQAALLSPRKIARLITPSFMQRDDWLTAQPPDLLDTFSNAVAQNAATTLQRFITLLNQGDAQARPISRALASRTLGGELPDTATLTRGLGWLRNIDLRAQVPSIAQPTLLIHGERDPLMPLAAAHWLREALPQARLETFANAAHAPFLADPERFATLAGDFCHEK